LSTISTIFFGTYKLQEVSRISSKEQVTIPKSKEAQEKGITEEDLLKELEIVREEIIPIDPENLRQTHFPGKSQGLEKD
jgi:hypothetical protein